MQISTRGNPSKLFRNLMIFIWDCHDVRISYTAIVLSCLFPSRVTLPHVETCHVRLRQRKPRPNLPTSWKQRTTWRFVLIRARTPVLRSCILRRGCRCGMFFTGYLQTIQGSSCSRMVFRIWKRLSSNRLRLNRWTSTDYGRLRENFTGTCRHSLFGTGGSRPWLSWNARIRMSV